MLYMYSHIKNMIHIKKQVQRPNANNTPDDDPIKVESSRFFKILM
jgi:hypothetical protein